MIAVPARKGIWNIKWNPDGTRMVSYGKDDKIWVHDKKDNYRVVSELRGHSKCVRDV
jgi:WD40 repeat protein